MKERKKEINEKNLNTVTGGKLKPIKDYEKK
jgi:bacteriocin-like protein